MSFAAYRFQGSEQNGAGSAFIHAPGSPAAMTRRACEQAASNELPVALIGEAGTGKESLARFIHQQSARADGPFVPVSCAMGDAALLEAELFGHVAGAVSGVGVERAGRVAAASGGTLFLDEVGALPQALQVRLVRLLQDGRYQPVGSGELVAADFRLIVGTERDLAEAVEAGRFRRDLYYLMFVSPVRAAPLRERPEDIPVLFDHMWRKKGQTRSVDPAVIECLMNYPFAGNLRELENLIGRLAANAVGPRITLDDLPPKFMDHGARTPVPVAVSATGDEMGVFNQHGFPPVSITLPIDLPGMLRALENAYIDSALASTGNNKKEAAQRLGMGRTTLVEKLRRRGPVRVRGETPS